MTQFETIVTRHTDTPLSRYRVDFIGDEGDSVSVECSLRAGEEPSREQVVDAARHMLRAIAEDEAGSIPGSDGNAGYPGATSEREQLLPF